MSPMVWKGGGLRVERTEHRALPARPAPTTRKAAVPERFRAAGVRVVEIFGGNVLLRKDLLIPVLHYLHDNGICIHLPTNQIGMEMARPEVLPVTVMSISRYR